MKFTVFGSSGFIGRHLSRYLRDQGMEVHTPPRGTDNLRGQRLGHVIYAIGLTGNFRQRPDAAVEAHVNTLQRMMAEADFDSWLYLSSTRVYGNLAGDERANEDAVLRVKPGADSLYDLSKLLGESICLGNDAGTVRVARLSNVYGTGQSVDTFLGSIIAELAATGAVAFRESSASSKDYVAIDDAVSILHKIAIGGRERLYNVARGVAVSHLELAESIRQCGYKAEFALNASSRCFPPIDCTRAASEFGEAKGDILKDLPSLIERAARAGIRVKKNG